MKKKCYKFKMNTLIMNILCIVLFVILIILFILTYPSKIVYKDINSYFYLLVIVWMILHEFLHYVGFLLGNGVKNKDLYLGMYLEKGIFYCMCKKRINKKSIIVALLFPLFFIGIVTLIIGYIINNTNLCLLSIVNISGAIGDIMMTIQMIKFPKDIEYFDKDDSTGYNIISKKDLSKIKVFGLELDEVKDFEESDTYIYDHQKVRISKLSWILLLFVIFLLVLSLIK